MAIFKKTIPIIGAFLLWGTVLYATVVNDAIQVKEKEFAFGKHPVLQADVVELEFTVDQTRTKDLPLTASKTGKSKIDRLSQNFGFEYRVKPMESIALKQSFKVGVARRYDSNEGYFDDQTEDHWNQLQRTELALSNESKLVQFKLFQQYRQVFQADRELPDAFFNYGGKVDIRIARNLTISPEWSMEESTDHQLRRTDRERYGARLSWRPLKGLAVKPEAYAERLTNHVGQPRDRQGAGIALTKSFAKQYLSLQVKPLYIEEHVDVGHHGNQSIQRLDASLAWNPVKQLSLRTGGIVEQKDYYIQHREDTNERIYSSIVHRPLDEFTVSFRGDYRLKTNEYEFSSYRDAEEAQMKVSVTPEFHLSDYLVASAQYLYEYRTPNKNVETPEAQVVTVSLRGQF